MSAFISLGLKVPSSEVWRDRSSLTCLSAEAENEGDRQWKGVRPSQ
jgi:hypothetical protein